MKELFFHEDDLEMGNIDLVSNYIAYSGNTWEIADAQVYSPADVNVEFKTANILTSEIQAVLINFLPKFKKTKSGYGNSSWKHECVAAYGTNCSFAVVLEGDTRTINNIWFLLSELDNKEKFALKELFAFLNTKGEFLFSDNHWDFQCKTSEWKLFEAYCADKF